MSTFYAEAFDLKLQKWNFFNNCNYLSINEDLRFGASLITFNAHMQHFMEIVDVLLLWGIFLTAYLNREAKEKEKET